MWYDEIKSNRNKETENGLSTLKGQNEPFHSKLKDSEWIKSPQVGSTLRLVNGFRDDWEESNMGTYW